ncbi:hypothetical protein FACS1894154_00900 [Betaproteobacteria bacterium]|nr:hypothetical protein FACS1894154_00900 [Betaproteobacteria bacterium]
MPLWVARIFSRIASTSLRSTAGSRARHRITAGLGLIPADLAAACADSYRRLRALQHRQRLNDQPARLPPAEVAAAREPILTLWQSVFGETEIEMIEDWKQT